MALLQPGLAASAVTPSPPRTFEAAAATEPGRLTNLAHLNFLGDTVAPPVQAGHTTYRLDEDPQVGVLWTYADRRDGGVYEPVGGGPYDAATDTWGQGAFNTDDLTRAAVVYLRHWKLFDDETSRERAYQLLRAVTYMQTTSGPDAGNSVLWMQPDGAINPSPEPVELPDPSDSGESYWVARTVWALGEGYRAFAGVDPEFAAFLSDRLALALTALDRDSLTRYGQWEIADGARVPAWLIADGADATAEAVLGLAAYLEAAPATGADPVRTDRVRLSLARYAEGIAAMSRGDATQWPYGAILPWALSQSIWHAWASQMPASLARAAAALDQPGLLHAAVTDSAVFTPALLTSTGPINGWQPTPTDRTQIAYGIDSRVQSLLAVAEVTGRPGFDELGAITASWYFGANRAGAAMYDRATGVTFDGLSADGVVNQNSGAESAIHGVLTMLALDAHPAVAAAAQGATSLVDLDGIEVVEAESATLSGAARVVSLTDGWTGESLWSGSAFVDIGQRGRADWTLSVSDQPRLVQPVVNLGTDRRSARLAWTTGRKPLGQLATGAGGDQGITAAPGALTPVTLGRELPAGSTRLSVRVRGRALVPAQLDAVLLTPRVSRLVLDGPAGGTALLRNAGSRAERTSVALPGGGTAIARSYDDEGVLRGEVQVRGEAVRVRVLPGGFTTVTR